MTTVVIKAGGGKLQLHAQGHATGSEQVCAAVSGLVYTLAGYVSHFGAEMRLVNGDADIVCDDRQENRIAFSVTAVGLRQIAHSYPDFLAVEENILNSAAASG